MSDRFHAAPIDLEPDGAEEGSALSDFSKTGPRSAR